MSRLFHQPSGNRAPAYNERELQYDEILLIIKEAEAIGIAPEYLRFDNPNVDGTFYDPWLDIINIRGNIFSDPYSPHPRDVMSVKAVLAHEYYGHRPYRAHYLLELERGSSRDTWNDEFRARYTENMTSDLLPCRGHCDTAQSCLAKLCRKHFAYL